MKPLASDSSVILGGFSTQIFGSSINNHERRQVFSFPFFFYPLISLPLNPPSIAKCPYSTPVKRVGNIIGQNTEFSWEQVLEVTWLTLIHYSMNSDYLSRQSCFHVINFSENGLLFKFGEKL